MPKAYITRHKRRERPEERIVDFGFDSHRDNAMYWQTQEQAALDCALFNHNGIEIPSSEGGTHICKNFKVEKRRSGEFVIFCEAPFIPKNASSNSA
jgi:hypothetical protein